jgi:hypothetical protein
MRSLLRIVLVLLAGAVAIAFGVVCIFVLATHFIVGSDSPGILVIAKDGLRTWIPLVVALLALWFVGTLAWLLFLARRRASAARISLLQYFDLTPEQKSKLAGSIKEVE